MNASIKIETNPGHPEGRWFEIAGKPQSVQSLHVFKSEAEAHNAGFMMANRIFRYGVTEMRVYPFEGHDHIAVFLKNSSDWDKLSGSGGAVTVEKAVSDYFSDQLLKNGFALLRDMRDKPGSSSGSTKDIAGKMDDHLQKIKPETVDRHGGKVRVVEFNAKSGLLTIGLGEACSSGCSTSSFGTKAAIAPPMRSRFPEILKIDFIFE